MPKENQEWEIEFSRRFKSYLNINDWGESSVELDLKDFIRNLLSKAREEERRKMLGKLTDEFYEFSTGKAWEAEQQEWVILHEPKEVIKRLTDAIKEME